MPNRGCGDHREENALYLVIDVGYEGKPIDAFLLDPPIPWTFGTFRGCQPVQRPDGIHDIVIWIGEVYYPSVADYVEEVARMGLSRRITKRFPFHLLDPERSRMLLVHPNAIPHFPYEVTPPLSLYPHRAAQGESACQHRGDLKSGRRDQHQGRPCLYHCWPLGWLLPDTATRTREVRRIQDREYALVNMPGFTYQIVPPASGAAMPYGAGIFATLPIAKLEYVARSAGAQRSPVPAAIRRQGFRVEIMEE